MKATSIITTLRARVAMTLLLALTTFTGSWATNFITDVMLIGGSKSEVNTLKNTYTAEGWTVIDKDLNAGCGSSSDYIYLLYKTADNNNTANLTFITDFYISTKTGTVDKDITYNGRTYHLVPFDGGTHFENIQGNLNSNAGGDDIHLYYTTTFKLNSNLSPDNMAVDSIAFNDDINRAVGKNGGNTAYDLNAGCGSSSDYIYMHLNTKRANWWTVQKNTDGTRCRIRGYESSFSYPVAIPAIIEGAAVEDIYSNVDCTKFTNLQKIYFHSSSIKTTMPSVANCSQFTQVNLVDNNGNVTEDKLPSSITSIPNIAFKDTKIKNLIMPNVVNMGDSAFIKCDSLKSVSFGNNLASIGNFAFKGCTNLKKVNISNLAAWCNISFGNSESNPLYFAHDLYLNNTKITALTIPNGVTSIGSNAFCYCTGLTSVTIPSSVTGIEETAFEGCINMDSVRINSNAIVSKNYTGSPYLKDIFGIQVKKYTIGNNVTSIGESAFKGCSALTSVTIPNSVTSIGNNAFKGCYALISVIIPNSVTNIGRSAFENCSALTSVTIGNSVTNIGNSAFFNCSALTSVTIPNSVTSIGNNAFKGCYALNSVIIPNSVTNIGSEAFYNCSALGSISIPNSVTNIDDYTFSKCYSLSSVDLGTSVKSIGEYAFSNCSALESISIPNSVTSIGVDAFYECI